MKSMLALTVVAALLLCTGCGGDSHESLAAEAVSTNKDLLATLESVKDEATAKAAKPKLKSLVEKMNDINKRETKLTKPSEAEIKAIETKYGKEMEDIQMKMAGVMMRIAFDPKISAELQDIDMRGK